MREYMVDEFVSDTSSCTLDEQIDKKVSLLYDLCMLYKSGRKPDTREDAVRKLLASYSSEALVDNAVHDVVVGNCTLNQLLKRKGFL